MLKLSIVVPCYNEEAVVAEAAKRLLATLERLVRNGKVAADSRLYFVDDGSGDQTWPIIERLAREDRRVHGIKLSCNRGHQYALLAGLMNAEGDAVVSVDADLQDDIEVIEDMVDAHAEGNDVVYGVRRDRSSDSFFKRNTAALYYMLLRLMGVEVVFNHADYRLMSRRALESLSNYEESNLFLRGVIRSIGFPSTVVEYERRKRFSGESKYPLRKMLSLAVNGVTSFSTTPLRIIALLGFIFFLFSILLSIWVVWVKFVAADAVPGWASSVLPMYFLGGVQLLSIGVVGEYVAKIYMETKRRPRYIIEKRI